MHSRWRRRSPAQSCSPSSRRGTSTFREPRGISSFPPSCDTRRAGDDAESDSPRGHAAHGGATFRVVTGRSLTILRVPRRLHSKLTRYAWFAGVHGCVVVAALLGAFGSAGGLVVVLASLPFMLAGP